MLKNAEHVGIPQVQNGDGWSRGSHYYFLVCFHKEQKKNRQRNRRVGKNQKSKRAKGKESELSEV
jgi:hypothetical protein